MKLIIIVLIRPAFLYCLLFSNENNQLITWNNTKTQENVSACVRDLSPRVVYFFCCNFISNTQQFMKRKFFFFIGFNVNKMDVNSKWIWSPPLETNFHEQCSVVARISRISIGFNDEKTVAQFPVTWQPKLVVPSDLTAQTGRTADQCSRRWRCELIKMLLESAVFQFAIRKNDIENLDLV